MLKVSIVTVCLNSEKHIEDTIRSVSFQTYPNIEYIIVDGGSSDKTLSVIGKYKERIAKVISEKDGGIYDAMNKGVRAATGDVIYFLNASDHFFDENRVASMVSVFESHPEADLVIGRVKGINAPATKPEPIPSVEGDFSKRSEILINGICHQRIFARRRLFEKIGMFDLDYSVCADQAWMFKAIYKNAKIVFLDQIIACYDLGGFSLRNRFKMYREGLWARFRNMPLLEFFLFLGPVFYVALRRRIVNFFRGRLKS